MNATRLVELEALIRVWQMAQQRNGGARVCAKLLLGLYDDTRFPFNLTDLRLLDATYLEAALTVLRMDARREMEVHIVLQRSCNWPGMGPRFEILACDWDLKGRCSRAEERRERAWLAEWASNEEAQMPTLLKAVA
jgi:hypothetical protein